MHIDEFLRMQDELQIRMGEASGVTTSPSNMSDDELAEFITWNCTALMAELGEMLQEVGWKPWASSRHINGDDALREMVDAWHFFLNIMLAIGAWAQEPIGRTGDFFTDYYREKNAKNLRRQVEGYDGVSTKCPGCDRDISGLPRERLTPMNVGPEKVIHFCTQSCARDYREEHAMGEHPDRPVFRDPPTGAQVDKEPLFPADPEAPQAVKPEGKRYPDYATAMNPHALKMVTEAELSGEPLFCLRARDFFSIQVIAGYAELVDKYGPDNPDFLANIVDALGEFKEWQKANTAVVRYPD